MQTTNAHVAPTRTLRAVALPRDITDAISFTVGARHYDIDYEFTGSTGSSFGCKFYTGEDRCDGQGFDNRVTERLESLGQFSSSGDIADLETCVSSSGRAMSAQSASAAPFGSVARTLMRSSSGAASLGDLRRIKEDAREPGPSVRGRGVGAEQRDLPLQLFGVFGVRCEREELLEVGDGGLRVLKPHPQVAAVTPLAGDLGG